MRVISAAAWQFLTGAMYRVLFALDVVQRLMLFSA
jgi:hypothetical protein